MVLVADYWEEKLIMLTSTDLKRIFRFQQELYISCNVEGFPLKVISTLVKEEHVLHTLTTELLQLLGLTKREAEVLYWVTQDKSDKEIALILNLSTGTVKKHLEHIYTKFGVQTRIAALMYALKTLGMLN